MRIRSCLLAASAASLVVAMAAPAQAGTTWGSPQEISSKLGRSISLSNDGTMAAWIRTNRSNGDGPVRTAYYKSKKKGWTPSAPIAGTAGITNVQMAADGGVLFAEEPGTGYVMSQRSTGNHWGTATTVVSGTNLAFGQMSSLANTIAWVDWTGADDYPVDIPGSIKVQTGSLVSGWTAPVEIGKTNLTYDDVSPMTMSSDGSTIAWLDETFALKAVTRQEDGSWSAPFLIKQFASDPNLKVLQLSAAGTALVWTTYDSEGLLYSLRTGTSWNPVGYVTTDEIRGAALAPNGTVVAYGNSERKLIVRTWDGTSWVKPKVLGSSSNPTIAMTNKTVAWVSDRYSGSSLRVSVYAKNKWQPATKRASAAQSPALTANGKTLAWGDTSKKRIYSAKR